MGYAKRAKKFDTEKIKFAQTPYFSSRASKFNFRGVQEPEHAPDFSPRVLDIFDDRVEVSNPGSLIIKEEEFGKRSLSRNPLIFSLLQKLELVEQVGSGISRIKGEMTNGGLKEPKFEFGKFFSVIFSRPTKEDIGKLAGEKTVEKTVEKIIQLIKENPQITQEELVKITGLSRRGVEWNIQQLKAKGFIRRVGPDRGGYWEVIGK